MTRLTIKREIEATQWLGEGHPLPDHTFLCVPEVHWSADRKLVYFTFAELSPRHWIDAEPRPMPPPEKLDFMCSGLTTVRQDGSEYWRQVMPFSMWSVKSEASVKRDHRAVYLDKADTPLVETFLDYCAAERWSNPLPPRAEFRVVDGKYGRGFKPVYMRPGDWIMSEQGAEPRAVSDGDFQAMRR